MNQNEFSTKLQQLRVRLEPAFCAATSHNPDGWCKEFPSAGHCAVVSLVTVFALPQETEPRMASTKVCGMSHWFVRAWREIPNDRGDLFSAEADVDLTADQFGPAFPMLCIGNAGNLWPGSLLRSVAELDMKTLQRAETLAINARLLGVADRIRDIIEARLENGQ